MGLYGSWDYWDYNFCAPSSWKTTKDRIRYSDYAAEAMTSFMAGSGSYRYNAHPWSWAEGHAATTCEVCIAIAKKNCIHSPYHAHDGVIVYADMKKRGNPRIFQGLWYPTYEYAQAARCRAAGCEHYKCMGWIPGVTSPVAEEKIARTTCLHKHVLRRNIYGQTAQDIEAKAIAEGAKFFGVSESEIRVSPTSDNMIYKVDLGNYPHAGEYRADMNISVKE